MLIAQSTMADSIGCSTMPNKFRYLGVMVGEHMSRHKSWDEVVVKLKTRLSKWKAKTLSIGEASKNKKISWLAWNRFKLPRKMEVLASSSFHALNRALLLKWLWRFVSQDGSLWFRVIKAVYGPSLGSHSSRSASIWSTILREVHVLKNNGFDFLSYCSKRVGDGNSTRFWLESWKGDKPFCVAFPRMFGLELNCEISVAAKMAAPLEETFRRPVRGGMEQHQFSELNSIYGSVSLSSCSDRWVCSLSRDGSFSVKEVRIAIDDLYLPSHSIPTRWVKVIPIKINIFALDRARRVSPYEELILSQRGCFAVFYSWSDMAISGVEDVDHVFFGCNLAMLSQGRFVSFCGGWWDFLIEKLDNHNALVQLFRTARNKYMEADIPEFKIKLYNVIGTRQYELPTADTIGAIVFGGSSVMEIEFSLIVEEHSCFPQRVNKLHPCYMALQFPLLFIYGEEGYKKDMTLLNIPDQSTRADKRMSMNMYYSYQIHDRFNHYSLLPCGGKLFHQYIVTLHFTIEQSRLDYIRQKQSNIRNEYLSGLYDAIIRGDRDGSDLRTRIVLTASIIGGPRYMYAHYPDALAICCVHDDDDLASLQIYSKGTDRVVANVTKPIGDSSSTSNISNIQIDEINFFVEARYIGPHERMLLCHQKGCTSFLDIRTINEKVYPTNRSACEAFGLLGDDQEWVRALEEAVVSATLLADLLRENDLIIWDEAPMNDRRCFEALDRSLRDILNEPHTLFGGKSIMLGGDFRQTLPVKKKALKMEIIDASITASYLWPSFKTYTLRQNMQLTQPGMTETEKWRVKSFSAWFLDIGDGKIGEADETNIEDFSIVSIPNDLCIADSDTTISELINFIYDHETFQRPTAKELQKKAIVCPKNETTDIINARVLLLLNHQHCTYLSSDEATTHGNDSGETKLLYPNEYLNSLKFAGLPPHRLELKVGAPIILLRNLNLTGGLCNGTRI
ncbi:DNA helicase [Tanacetum coccineum]